MVRTTLVAAIALTATLAGGGCALLPARPLPTIESFEVQRYLGTWYEVARLPNVFQRRCTGEVTATYGTRTDGRIAVTNRCRTADGVIEATGVARFEDEARGRLTVTFAPEALSWLPFVWGRYWILALDPDYTLALVGEPHREYLWILSRTPHPDEARVAALIERARALGFPAEQLQRTRP